MNEWMVLALQRGALAVFLMMTVIWAVSVKRRNAGIVDIFWGMGFVLVAWVYYPLGPEEIRQTVLLALVTVWGLRLAAHIYWRSRGHGEDFRYRAFRQRAGASFWWRSYVTVFLLQGVLMVVLSAPLWMALTAPQTANWRWSDTVGVILWSVGFFFEAVGDWQLVRFKSRPENRGRVLNQGLWAYTRHPNYFGDATLWWGYFFFALAVPYGVYTLPCALLMTVLLLKVSGVTLLEKTIVDRRPEYRDYIASTSAFVPWFPRRSPTN